MIYLYKTTIILWPTFVNTLTERWNFYLFKYLFPSWGEHRNFWRLRLNRTLPWPALWLAELKRLQGFYWIPQLSIFTRRRDMLCSSFSTFLFVVCGFVLCARFFMHIILEIILKILLLNMSVLFGLFHKHIDFDLLGYTLTNSFIERK